MGRLKKKDPVNLDFVVPSKFYVSYVEDATPKLKSFFTKEETTRFVANFTLKHQGKVNDGWWIDMVFEGRLVYKE